VEADAAPVAAECVPAGHECAQVVHSVQPSLSPQMHLRLELQKMPVLGIRVLKYRE
jgi:hypothetical protein